MKNYLLNKEQYQSVTAAWKSTQRHSSTSHIIYNLLRSLEISRGFTPITDSTKLSNGAKAWQGFNCALSSARMILKRPGPVSKWCTEAQYAINMKNYIERIESFGIVYDAELVEKMYDTLHNTLLEYTHE